MILRLGAIGYPVEELQKRLKNLGLYNGRLDGNYGLATKNAVATYQLLRGLVSDGIAGPKTLAMIGMSQITNLDNVETQEIPARSPAKPRVLLEGERVALFGRIEYTRTPQPGNAEHITIKNDFEDRNITRVLIPQLIGVSTYGGSFSGNVAWHIAGVKQLLDFWRAVELAALLDKVIFWDGSYMPRLQRGSTTRLSAHAWGTAFDINAEWNQLNHVPAKRGEKGCVRELVSIANEYGFAWGGDFSGRLDGMHFEIAKLL